LKRKWDIKGEESMELMDIIKARKSVRKYRQEPIPREDIIKCIEAARLAPSAENVQPWRFIVIDDPEVKKEFVKETCSGIYKPSSFIKNAAAIIVIVAKLDLVANFLGKGIQGTSYYLIDIGITGEHLVLRAQELGIGTCWIGWFNSKKAKNFFKLSPRHKVVSLISMGYPAPGGTKSKRDLDLDDILFFNKDTKGI